MMLMDPKRGENGQLRLKGCCLWQLSEKVFAKWSLLTLKDAPDGPDALFAIFCLQDKQWYAQGDPEYYLIEPCDVSVVVLCPFPHKLPFPQSSCTPSWL